MKNEDIFNYSDIEDLINNFPFDSNQENEMQLFIQKRINEYDFYTKGKNTLSLDLDEMLDNLNFKPELQYFYAVVDFFTTTFCYYSEKKNNKIINDYVTVTIRKIGENLIQKVNAFCFLCIKGNYSEAISISRSIYELVLSSHLIYEYPQLAEPFRDKERFLYYKFQKDVYGKIFDYSARKEFYSLYEKYGETLNENFGWTEKVFSARDKRFLKFLANKLELPNYYNSFYQEACAYVHASSYSLIHQELTSCLSFSSWVIVLLMRYCNDFYSLSFMNKRESKIIISFLSKMSISYIEKITDSFTKEVSTDDDETLTNHFK